MYMGFVLKVVKTGGPLGKRASHKGNPYEQTGERTSKS